MFFRRKDGSKKKHPLFATVPTTVPTTVEVSTETSPDDEWTRTLPATTKRSTTEMNTVLTTSRARMVTHNPSSASEDGKFIITTMSVVIGVVFLLILIVITAFVLKSRRRRRWNVRIYRDNQERHATAVYVDNIDGDEHSHQSHINGVHQAIYGQEIYRLPIRTFDHPELKSSIQQDDTNTIFGESKGQHVGSSQTSEEIVYENNDAIVKPNSASVSDHPVELALNPLQKGLNQEHNSDCDYEKAFPEPGQQIKRDSIIENKMKAVQSTSKPIKKCATTDECLTNKKHTRETTSEGINIATEIQMGKSAPTQVKKRPTIKPKPVMLTAKHTISDQRRTADLHEHPVVSPKPVLKAQHRWKHKKECTNNTVEDQTVSPYYENSLVNIKRAKFREAQLLQNVSPPGNTNYYYGNNATDKLNKSAESVVRQSSEYEYPENVIALPKQVLDQHENRHALKSEENPKPDYANISIHSKQDSNNTESVTNDYANADTVNELKLTKKLGQRSASASSSGNKPFANISTGTNALLENENDEMYLPMGMATMTEDVYIPMNLDASTHDVYLSMNVTVDDVYMPMERTDSHTQSDFSSTKLLNSLGTSCHNLATGNVAAPQPCGGSVEYVNISDRQSKYVNLFRSRSTDDVSTYDEYVNFKSCTYLTKKER